MSRKVKRNGEYDEQEGVSLLIYWLKNDDILEDKEFKKEMESTVRSLDEYLKRREIELFKIKSKNTDKYFDDELVERDTNIYWYWYRASKKI